MGVYIWNKLPSEYQEVEYIQSSGTQYINTGYVPNQKTKAEFKISNWNVPVTSPTTYSNIFGADQAYLNRGFNICSTGSSSVYSFGSAGGLINGYTGLNGSLTHIGEYSQSGLYVDGSLVVTPSTQTFTGLNLYLFALNRNGTLTEPASFRMHYFKIYDNGTLVRDFIPCYRKSDSVIGLYDLVNNQFYTNSGSGTFSKGADVVMTELKNAYIGEVWTPGSNTIAYFPLAENGLDVMGNYTLSNTGTQQTIGRSFTSQAQFSSTPSATRTIMARTKMVSASSNGGQCGILGIYGSYLAYTNTSSGHINKSFYIYYNGTSYYSTKNIIDNTWHHVAIVNNGSNSLVGYVDGVAYNTNSPGVGNASNNIVYNSSSNTINVVLSELILESKQWTQAELQDYYNKTKSNYGL